MFSLTTAWYYGRLGFPSSFLPTLIELKLCKTFPSSSFFLFATTTSSSSFSSRNCDCYLGRPMPGSKMALFFPMLFQRQKGSWQDKIPWGVVFLRSYNLAVEKYYEAAFHLRFGNSPFFSTQFFTFGRETRSRHFCWGYKRREEMDGNERISELNSSASSSPNICCLFLPSLSPHNRLLLPDRPFLNFGTLETAARRSWTTYIWS